MRTFMKWSKSAADRKQQMRHAGTPGQAPSPRAQGTRKIFLFDGSRASWPEVKPVTSMILNGS